MTRQIVTVALSALGLITLACSCQPSSDQMVRRAQLVGNENLKLKKEIQHKDAKIAELEKEIEQLKAEYAKFQDDSGQSSIKILQLLSDCQAKLAKYEGTDAPAINSAPAPQ
ncbi:MAG: hypothetical protein JXB18_03310 [Sedimentisphaerales bacterium]|nr:hypothetical protein [Sedimentisphaerales bacterium]